MIRPDIRARFQAILAKVDANPPPPRPWTVTRFRRHRRKKRADPARLPGQTSENSGDLTAMSNLRSRPGKDRPARREVTSVSDDDPGILEYHRGSDGRLTVEFNNA